MKVLSKNNIYFVLALFSMMSYTIIFIIMLYQPLGEWPWGLARYSVIYIPILISCILLVIAIRNNSKLLILIALIIIILVHVFDMRMFNNRRIHNLEEIRERNKEYLQENIN